MSFLKNIESKIFESAYYNFIRFNTISNFIAEMATQITSKNIKYFSQFLQKENNILVFDIGANKGHKTNALLKMGYRVVAVDPEKKSIETIEYRFNTYKSITIENKAVGAKEDKLTLHITASRSGLNTLSKDWVASKNTNFNNSYLVDVTTLDNLIKKHGLPYFIKIDVEGYEIDVLQGLSHPISIICFECNLPSFEQQTILCIEQLCELNNYKFAFARFDKIESTDWLNKQDMIDIVRSQKYDYMDIIAKAF